MTPAINDKRFNWTKKEEAYLRKHYATALAIDIAQALGRTELSVYRKANALGLRGIKKRPTQADQSGASRPHPKRVSLEKNSSAFKVVQASDAPPSNAWQKQFGLYRPTELQPSQRPGANDHERYPSIVGNERIWRDGRRERKG